VKVDLIECHVVDFVVESYEFVDSEADGYQAGPKNDACVDIVQFIEPKGHTEEKEQVERPYHFVE
jgi:hypothetical protein